MGTYSGHYNTVTSHQYIYTLTILVAIDLVSKDHDMSTERPDDNSSITDSAYGAGSINTGTGAVYVEVSQDSEVRSCNCIL